MGNEFLVQKCSKPLSDLNIIGCDDVRVCEVNNPEEPAVSNVKHAAHESSVSDDDGAAHGSPLPVEKAAVEYSISKYYGEWAIWVELRKKGDTPYDTLPTREEANAQAEYLSAGNLLRDYKIPPASVAGGHIRRRNHCHRINRRRRISPIGSI